MSKSSTSRFDGDCIYAYWASCRQMVRGVPTKHISFSQDALDVSNMKVELTAFHLPLIDKSFWGTPLAPLIQPILTIGRSARLS